jgi:hypothetical protein
MLTKKIKGKRVMRVLPVWRCVNKTTPFIWFEKYERFLTDLGYELGFISIEISGVQTISDSFYLTMTFRHLEGKTFMFMLMRSKQFFGGGITLKQDGVKTDFFMTATPSHGSFQESRTDIGNWFIEQIRDSWSLF